MFTIEQYVRNQGTPIGNAGVALINSNDLRDMRYDPGLSRPYLAEDGQMYVDVTINYEPKRDDKGNYVLNAAGDIEFTRIKQPQLVAERRARGLPVANVNNATVLRKDQWLQLDNTVLKAYRSRLRAYADLRSSSTLSMDGWATTVLEHEVITDPGSAMVSMEGLDEGRNFQPHFGLEGLPLPITHSNFWMSERFRATSANKGQPADMIRAEIAARRVGELIEQTTIGTQTGMTYGDSTRYLSAAKVYGYVNHPDRITKTNLTSAATMATNIATTGGGTFVSEVLAMLELGAAQNIFGPFMMYVSTGYDAQLDNDLKANSDITIRQRVREIDRITDVRRLDYLTGDVILLVQMTDDVCQAVNGMEVTTIQYDTQGGQQHNFVVLGIQVPRIRSAYKSGTTTKICGIIHGTTS